MLEKKLDTVIRDVPDFPKKGIIFKDITPLLSDPELSQEISLAFINKWKGMGVEGVVGIESRGFLYGPQIAVALGVPFIVVRKAGKLPYKTIRYSYDLEYGSAEIEMHTDAVSKGQKILIHDDLLATGGSSLAASELVKIAGGDVIGYSFIIELAFLKGREKLSPFSEGIQSLISY
ncbi:MAG: adenine phosphoribosyltransferase [Cyclobacteriaceae bacterium]